MIRPLNFRKDFNYLLFFDVETSFKYFIRKKNQKIEDCQLINKKQYEEYKIKNEKAYTKVYDIGLYQITKMISIIDQDNNSKCFIVEDEYLKSELEEVKTKYFEAEIYFGDDSDEIIEMFWVTIDNYMQENLNCRVFAHNIGFDLKQIDFFSRVKEFIGKDGKKIISACLSKPFFIKCQYDEDSILSFDDSFSFFSTSLNNLGKDIGIEKLDQKFDNENLIIDDNCIIYCLTDSYIIKEAICNLRKYLQDNELGTLGVTIASTAMNVWRTSFLEYPINNEYPKEIQEIERKIYYGGRNECYRIGLFRNIYYFDINSLYPYVMEKYKFPVQYKSTIKSDIEPFTKKYVSELLKNNDNYYIFKVIIDTDKNHLPLRNERLLFVKGKYEGYIHMAEFKYFWNRNEVIEVTEAIVYKQDYIFKSYIGFFKKEKYKYEDNPSYRNNSKLFQNSLYGKLAEHLRKSEFYENEEPLICSILEETEEGKHLKRDNFGYFGIQSEEFLNENAKNSFPVIAGAVTSYTRRELLNMIETIGIDKILYDDTDSLMSTVPVPKEYQNNKIYGKWKNEATKLYNKNNLPVKETLDVIIKGCKNYILLDIENNKILSIKSKGIKKDSKEIKEDFYSSNKWWTVKTTKVQNETMFTLKHTVVMHELKENTLEYKKGKTIFKGKESIKIDGVNLRYNVRQIKPWNINELKLLEKEC